MLSSQNDAIEGLWGKFGIGTPAFTGGSTKLSVTDNSPMINGDASP
jgi:hypothetical protein